MGETSLEPSKIMAKGKIGLFSMIESAANLRNSKVLFAMTLVLLGISVLLHFTVPEIAAIPYFMAFSAVMVLVSIAELVLIRRKKGVGTHLKWVIGISFIVSAATTTSTMGAAGSIIYVFPMLLSIQYCSFLYSLFISAITVMGAFVPLLLSSHLSYYDLNVIKMAPGTVLQVTKTLEASLGPEIIDEAGTKMNELLSVFLPIILLVNIAAAVSISITAAIRKSLLQQYHQFQITRE